VGVSDNRAAAAAARGRHKRRKDGSVCPATHDVAWRAATRSCNTHKHDSARTFGYGIGGARLRLPRGSEPAAGARSTGRPQPPPQRHGFPRTVRGTRERRTGKIRSGATNRLTIP
jgi:hypothetical protein